ncbi:MAG TPA: ATP-binding protein [Candidatus Saccharimonadales bacterium]|jgi:SpoVK/Ycf46/Vps4 family AAA+-type ATPase|nr:ATP-binding protein [Candidatus Saccharimonadales bacterium]
MFDKVREHFFPKPELPGADLTLPVDIPDDQIWPNPYEGDGVTFITEPDELYRAAEHQGKGPLTNMMMEAPLHGVTLDLRTNGSTFGLYGAVKYSDEKHGATDAFAEIKEPITERAVERGAEVMERGGFLVVTDLRSTPLVIGPGTKYDNRDSILVTTGDIEEGYERYVEIVPSPELTKENLENALGNVLGALALVVNVAYAKADAPHRRVITVARPPKTHEERMFEVFHDESTHIVEEVAEGLLVAKTEVSLDDIGGQTEAKEEIKALADGIAHPESYKEWGIRPPKGILLQGPPGTGKTLMARALASEADAKFFAITPTDIASKWYGDSEQKTQEIFDQAAEEERAIIFIDEIDAMTPKREGSHEASRRVLSVVLQNMDGMKEDGNVTLVAATNRPDDIDPAIKRPGRFDRHVNMNLPDEAGRQEVLDIHMRNALEVAQRDLFAPDFDLEAVAKATPGYSGVDLAEIIRRTLESKRREQRKTGVRSGLVTNEDALHEIQNYEHVKQSGANLGFTIKEK